MKFVHKPAFLREHSFTVRDKIWLKYFALEENDIIFSLLGSGSDVKIWYDRLKITGSGSLPLETTYRVMHTVKGVYTNPGLYIDKLAQYNLTSSDR